MNNNYNYYRENDYRFNNYQIPILKPTSKQEKMFLDMAEASFAAHDINLYLDLYPNDGNMLELFNKYREKANELTFVYEKEYGPIMLSSNSLNTSPFLWQTQSFPWNVGGVSNV